MPPSLDKSDNPCSRAGCSIYTVVEAQGRQIDATTTGVDAAHARLRDHEAKLATLEVQSNHGLERLARVESASSDQHRLLIELDGDVRGLSAEMQIVSATTGATHTLLQNHINDNTVKLERLTKRLIQIVGLVGAVVVLLALIHSALSGQPLLSMIVSFLSGLSGK